MRFSMKTLAANIVIGFKVRSVKICIARLNLLGAAIQFDSKMAYDNFSLFVSTSDPKYDGTKISVTIANEYTIEKRKV